MDCEWDERKRTHNLRKHGIDLFAACRIFETAVLEWVDDRLDYGEERIVAFGADRGRVLQVVYVWRGERRRLISARKATKDESKRYFQAIFSG